MKDIILVIIFLIYGIMGYFVMKKLDKAINDANRKRDKK